MKSNKTNFAKKNNGFTVIEVLVAMTILVLAATCFLPLFVSSYQGVIRSGNKSDATYRAQKDAENKMATDNYDNTGDLEINIGGKIIKMGGAMVNVQQTVAKSSSIVKVFVPTIVVAVNISPNYQMHYPNNKTIQVNVETRNVAKDAYATAALFNKSGNQLAISSNINIVDNKATIPLTISSSLNSGDYIVRVHVKDLTKDYDTDYSISLPRFVAIGNSGAVNASVFGEKWETTKTSGMYFNSITYGNGQYIAVGNSGKIFGTQDGFNWNDLSPLNTFNNLNSVVYSGTSFFAVGDAGTICYQTDLSSWTNLGSFTGENLKSIAYGNNSFIAVGDNIVLTFKEPVNGTFTAPVAVNPTLDSGDSIISIDYGMNNFYALTLNGNILSSADGTIWNKIGFCSATATKIKWLGDTLFAIGRNGLIETSTDGITWNDHSFKIGGTLISNTLNDIVLGNTLYEIAGDQIILYSLDGLTWTAVPTVNSAGQTITTPYLGAIASSK